MGMGMGYFNRKIISIHNDETLTEAELVFNQTVNTAVRKLPLIMSRNTCGIDGYTGKHDR